MAQDLSKVTELDVNAYGQPTSRELGAAIYMSLI